MVTYLALYAASDVYTNKPTSVGLLVYTILGKLFLVGVYCIYNKFLE